MSPIIHAGIGWLIAQPLERRRDRAIITAVAVLPDIDGVGLLISDELYAQWHHRLAHGVLAAVVVAFVLIVVERRLRLLALGLLSFHSHVATDLCGSGPGWPIWYFWPLSDVEWLPSWQWDLASWQNSSIGLVVILLCLAQARGRGRTPVELVSLRADAKVVAAIRARFGNAAARASPL